MALQVHGVLQAAEVLALSQLDLSDITVGPPRTVAHGAIAALVTDTGGTDVLPTRNDLLGHLALLERVGQVATVVPMRFGQVARDERALVTDYLDPQQGLLLATLQRLADHVELRLRGRYVEAEVLHEVIIRDPLAARLRHRQSLQAQIQLGERVIAGLEKRRRGDAERVLSALRPHAAEVAVTQMAEPLDAFTISFLVANAEMEAFEQQVESLGKQLAPTVTLELVGPLPPFTFVPGDR